MSSGSTANWGAGAALLAICLSSNALAQIEAHRDGPARGSAHGYFYEGEWVELPLDVTRLAVAMEPRDAVAAIGAALGRLPGTTAEAVPVEPLAIDGWSLVQLSAALQESVGVAKLVEEVAASGAFASPVFFDRLGGPLIVTPSLLVGLAPGAEHTLTKALEAHGRVSDVNWLGLRGLWRIEAASRNGFEVLRAANSLAREPGIEFAEPDVIFSGRGDLFPDDTFFSLQWGMHNTGQYGGIAGQDVDAPEAWDLTTGASGIRVVVLETGVQLNHPDLNLAPGRDFTGAGGAGGPHHPCDRHGTAVAGCISAVIDNGIGVAGLASDCPVAPAKTFTSTSPCTSGWITHGSWTVEALMWAVDSGARVTNNSNAYGFTSGAIALAYEQTRDLGVVHFAAAGNDASGVLAWPARIAVVNAVAALSPTGRRTLFSQFGPNLDFSAPGEFIVTTDRTGSDGYVSGDYVQIDGTSFASPYAAAVAALILSRNSGLSSAQVEEIMQRTCVDLGAPGYDTDYGWGFVNAQQAVESVCYADCDSDGSLTFFDFLCFQNRFAAGEPAADCDGDMALTFFDFLCFQNAFSSGCP